MCAGDAGAWRGLISLVLTGLSIHELIEFLSSGSNSNWVAVVVAAVAAAAAAAVVVIRMVA